MRDGYIKIIYMSKPAPVGVGYQKVVDGNVVGFFDEAGEPITDPPSTEYHVDNGKIIDHPKLGAVVRPETMASQAEIAEMNATAKRAATKGLS